MNSTLRSNLASRKSFSKLSAIAAALLFAATTAWAIEQPFEWNESTDGSWNTAEFVTFPDAAGLDLPNDYFPAVNFPEVAGLDLPADYFTRVILVDDDYGEPMYIVLASADPLQAP